MTSQGSPYARFQRACATGNALLIVSAAAELPRLDLDQALLVCLAYLAQDDHARYERAIVRWHSRYCGEHRPSLAEAQLVLAALAALASGDASAREAAADGLAACFTERGLAGGADAIERWCAGTLLRPRQAPSGATTRGR